MDFVANVFTLAEKRLLSSIADKYSKLIADGILAPFLN